MTQLSLFSDSLSGTIAYSAQVGVNNEKDRTNRQVDAVRKIMTNWMASQFLCCHYLEWLTLSEIQEKLLDVYNIQASESGISARIRDLRKPEFGGHTIERRARSGNLYEYRMVK